MPDSVRAGELKKYCTEKNFQLIDLLEDHGKAHNATVAQMALAWLLQRPAITAPIIGANNPDQLKDALGSVSIRLTPDDVLAIDDASSWN